MTTTADAPRLLPVDDDLDTGGFFEAARRGELAIRRCNGCDAVLHVPRAYCRHCGSWEGRWEVVDGAATLHSWTVVTHQVHPAYPVPYTVVLVDLDALPGTRSSARSTATTTSSPACRCEVWFDESASLDGAVSRSGARPRR